MARGQAERLMPLLERVLAEAGKAWADIDRIGVGVGPGNFTGIRISVAAARGLALSLAVPAIGVDGFEATASGRARPCTVRLPATGGLVYQRSFGAGTGGPELVPSETDPDAEPCPALAPGELATAIAQIAAHRPDGGGERPAPLYIRSPDAAPPRVAPPVILP